MIGIKMEDSKFIYVGQSGEKVLLDFGNYMDNKSCIPMHKLPDMEITTILDIILSLVNGQEQEDSTLSYAATLVDILCASLLIKTQNSVRMLEYGCQDGWLSAHLAELTGRFCEDSTLVCAYDTMDESWMVWMDRISKIAQPPNLSYVAGDYGSLHLERNYFDITVVNGKVNFLCPEQVLSDALQMTADGGYIICLSDNSPLLDSCFQLFFEQREQFEITPTQTVMMARKADCVWYQSEPFDLQARFTELTMRARAARERKGVPLRDIFDVIADLKQGISSAIHAGEIDWKVRLLKEKELLVERIVTLQRRF